MTIREILKKDNLIVIITAFILGFLIGLNF